MLIPVVYYLLFSALLIEVAELAVRLGNTLVVLSNHSLCEVDTLIDSSKRVLLLTITGLIFVFLA